MVEFIEFMVEVGVAKPESIAMTHFTRDYFALVHRVSPEG
jgi:hypothetical protein